MQYLCRCIWKFNGKCCLLSANSSFYMWDEMNPLKIHYLKIQVLLYLRTFNLQTFRNTNNPALRSSSLFYWFGQAQPGPLGMVKKKNLLPTATNQTTITQTSILQPNDYTHYTTPVPMSLWVHKHNSLNHQHAPLKIRCKDS
jgi:hypothetical protein